MEPQKTTNNLMVSFQFRQGINAIRLARHQNGTIPSTSNLKQNIKNQKP